MHLPTTGFAGDASLQQQSIRGQGRRRSGVSAAVPGVFGAIGGINGEEVIE